MSRQLSYYHRNADRINKNTARRRQTADGRATYLLAACRRRAKDKGFELELDKQWIKERLEAGCEITGLPFDYSLGPRGPRTGSVDRIDSSKGYTKDNCRVILWALNCAFATWGEAEFRAIFAAERNTPDNLSFLHMAA